MIRSKDRDHLTSGISAYLTELGLDREHDGRSKSCRVVELTSYNKHIFLGDSNICIFKESGIQIFSGGNTAEFLVQVESELKRVSVTETIPGHT